MSQNRKGWIGFCKRVPGPGKLLRVSVGALLVVTWTVVVQAATSPSQPPQAPPTPFKMLGTWNGAEILSRLINQYQSIHGDLYLIDFTPHDSPQVVQLLADPQRLHPIWRGKIKVGVTLDSRLSEAIKKEAITAQLQTVLLGRFVVAVAVNAKNAPHPTPSVSIEDLREIYTGRKTLWKDVPGFRNPGKIELYASSLDTTTAGMLFEKRSLGISKYFRRIFLTQLKLGKRIPTPR